MPSPDIFLSYNREDAPRAKQFADAFAAEGFDVWWDAQLRSGEAYDKVTEDALKSAGAVVVLWSPRSVDSRWVRAEATLAERRGTLMPAMIEPCERPIMFELTHTAELSHWHGDRKDPAWQSFVGDLRKLIGSKPAGAEAGEAATAPAGVPERAWPAPLRKTYIIAGIAAAVLAVLGIYYLYNANGAASGTAALAPKDSVPVLVRPFAAGGTGDETEKALAGGITDELIVRLRRIPQLRVGSAEADGAGTSSAFAGAYVVDGNIRSSGDQLRVTARLTNAKGEILWTDTFDRKLAQMFELQEVIAGKIANSLSVSLDVGADSVAYGGTSNPEAYAAFLQYKANEFLDQGVALGYLQRAIALDPDYLKALSALASSYNPRITYAASKQEADDLLAKMDASTQHMLETNPNLWMSHTSRAWYFIDRNDIASTEKEVERAAKLDEQNDPALPAELATISYCLGQVKRASAFVRSAEIIDPLYRNDPRTIRDLVYNGQYEAAIAQFDKLAEDGNDGRFNHTLEVFWAYILSGKERDAIAFAGRRSAGDQAMLVSAFKAGKDLPPESLPELKAWADKKYGQVGQFDLANTALFASHYGHPELAVGLMRQAYERPGGYASLIVWHPAFAEARKSPAFVKLVTDLGYVKAWRETGKWPDFCHSTPDGGVACE